MALYKSGPLKRIHQCWAVMVLFDSSLKVGDRTGQITAQMNISDLRSLLGIQDDSSET